MFVLSIQNRCFIIEIDICPQNRYSSIEVSPGRHSSDAASMQVSASHFLLGLFESAFHLQFCDRVMPALPSIARILSLSCSLFDVFRRSGIRFEVLALHESRLTRSLDSVVFNGQSHCRSIETWSFDRNRLVRNMPISLSIQNFYASQSINRF
jgi:hypothetical protein